MSDDHSGIDKKFNLDLRLEAYKQSCEISRKCFEQTFIFSNNAIRGLFIISAGASVALLNAKIIDAGRAYAIEYAIHFGVCAFLCAVCSAISYVGQRLYTQEAYEKSNDIFSKIYSNSWGESDREKQLRKWADIVNYISITAYCFTALLFISRVVGLYCLASSGKI